FLVVTGMLSSIAWLNPIAKPHNEITARSKQAAMQPMRAQVTADHPKMNLDNPLFNPVFFLSDPLKAEIKKGLASAEKELHFTEGEPEVPFAPMIADAFDQASSELMGKKEWEEAIAKMDFAKMKLDNVFNFDTASLPAAARGPLKEDLARSLKSMETDIAKAKVEMSKAMKMAGDIKLDREKINRDIKNAMDALQKLPLDKIVYNALQVPAMLFGDEARKQQPIRKPRLKGTDKIKLQEHGAEDVHLENESPLADEHPDMDEEMTVPHVQDDALAPALLAELAKLPNADNIGKDLVKMLRFKKFLKELEKLQANPKMIPVVFKERKAEDKKAAVQLR
ncbi:MAG: Signal transducer regulating beta-lactamase production, contains metallopeptidase domain, partial [Sediminibacterium sp.]|nr:Signal transducer regulating beta-lactamase production, contains metallopeptidase domain [Sediminibacterium sp.]